MLAWKRLCTRPGARRPPERGARLSGSMGLQVGPNARMVPLTSKASGSNDSLRGPAGCSHLAFDTQWSGGLTSASCSKLSCQQSSKRSPILDLLGCATARYSAHETRLRRRPRTRGGLRVSARLQSRCVPADVRGLDGPCQGRHRLGGADGLSHRPHQRRRGRVLGLVSMYRDPSLLGCHAGLPNHQAVGSEWSLGRFAR